MTKEIFYQVVDWLRQITKNTEFDGHVYAVGGCCRDIIAGDEIKDIDLAVTLPDGGVRLAKFLRKRHMLSQAPVLFQKFGTARIYLKRFPAVELEIVQTRKANYTPENKKNPALAFGSLEEDCVRRDLTMNTLYYDIKTGEMLDLTGHGIEDASSRYLRTPADPDSVLSDDPLRILRIFRFAARYDAKIEPELYDAMLRHVPELVTISVERLRNEFERILGGPRAVESIGRLYAAKIIQFVLPELFPQSDATGECWNHAFQVFRDLVDECPDCSVEVRYAALLHDVAKYHMTSESSDPSGRMIYLNHETASARIARQALRRLHAQTPEMRRVITYIMAHINGSPDVVGRWRMKDRQLRRLHLDLQTRKAFMEFLALVRANARANGNYGLDISPADEMERRTLEMEREGTDMLDYKLPISDKEISRLCNSSLDQDIENAKKKMLKALCLTPNMKPKALRDLIHRTAGSSAGSDAPALSSSHSSSTSNQSTSGATRKPRSRSSRKRSNHRRQRHA